MQTYTFVVRANADTVEQALAARAAGAGGIGLCRTEKMLASMERELLVRSTVAVNGQVSQQQMLDTLLPRHQAELERLFRACTPLPVTLRLLDPPLRDLLPSSQQIDFATKNARTEEDWEEFVHYDSLRQHYAQLTEINPLMGHRGCRLSITQPAILRMQVTAILQAALALQQDGLSIAPDILIPLVASEEETSYVAKKIRAIAADVFAAHAARVPFRVGALIELPRAAILAGEIARHVDFLSFGTNDLTTMTYGSSPQDMRRYLAPYLKEGIFEADPFVALDQKGVGHLIAIAILNARAEKPDMEIGICGDHCADPASVHFLRLLGASYISCAVPCIASAQFAWHQDEALAGHPA